MVSLVHYLFLSIEMSMWWSCLVWLFSHSSYVFNGTSREGAPPYPYTHVSPPTCCCGLRGTPYFYGLRRTAAVTQIPNWRPMLTPLAFCGKCSQWFHSFYLDLLWKPTPYVYVEALPIVSPFVRRCAVSSSQIRFGEMTLFISRHSRSWTDWSPARLATKSLFYHTRL